MSMLNEHKRILCQPSFQQVNSIVMMCGVKRLVVVMSSMGWIHVTAFPLIEPGNTITLLNFSPLLFSGQSMFYIFDMLPMLYICYILCHVYYTQTYHTYHKYVKIYKKKKKKKKIIGMRESQSMGQHQAWVIGKGAIACTRVFQPIA